MGEDTSVAGVPMDSFSRPDKRGGVENSFILVFQMSHGNRFIVLGMLVVSGGGRYT